MDLAAPISHEAGIDQWQAVEGGFYYHSVDRKAHFLQGNAAAAPAAPNAPLPQAAR